MAELLLEERDGGPLEKGQHHGMQPCYHLAKCLIEVLSEVATGRMALYWTSAQGFLCTHVTV